MINKIDKIVSYEAFTDFHWGRDVTPFKKFNLIYGWNGSGKTSLSRVFKLLEDKRNHEGSEIKLTVDGNSSLLGDMVANNHFPEVRVFNRDYIDDTVFKDSNQIAPIYYISKENTKNAVLLEKKQSELTKVNATYKKNEMLFKKADKALDEFCISQATLIRETLRSSGSTNRYNNYNKSQYKTAVLEMLKKPEYKQHILKEKQINESKQQTQSTEKPKIDLLIEFTFGWEVFESEVNNVLTKNVKLNMVQRLVDNPELGKWVKTGMDDYLSDDNKCPFCTQTIADDLLTSLKDHFNEEYNTLAKEIEVLQKSIEQTVSALNNYVLLDSALLYPIFSEEYETAKTALTNYKSSVIDYLNSVSNCLDKKLENPTILLPSMTCEYKELDTKIKVINAIFRKHNDHSGNLQKAIELARGKIASHYISVSVSEFLSKENVAQKQHDELTKAALLLHKIKTDIKDIETQLRNHRPPVNELNAEIEVFFSRGDIKFELEGNGYKITRNGEVVINLSDGERSAIAILYFLKSLNVSETECHRCTVVIDDPVSSQDINNLYSTFVYIMKKAVNVDQLILLTHNFSMFKYAKKWAKSRFKEDSRSFYHITCDTKLFEGKYFKQIELNALPSQLMKYESEYHYLFSLVYKYANGSSNGTDEQQLFYGNIARKIIETFLEFKYPHKIELQDKYLQLEGFDKARQMRIFRYINNLSHKALMGDYDPALMAITKQVMVDVLDLIAYYDPVHYKNYVKISI